MITAMLAATEISPVSIEIIFQIIKIYKDLVYKLIQYP